MHTQISAFMANDTLPTEYKKWPLNFLYGFFLVYIKIFEKQYGRAINNIKSGGENSHLFYDKQNDNDVVITFKQRKNSFSVIIFNSKDEFPTFEKNFGSKQF